MKHDRSVEPESTILTIGYEKTTIGDFIDRVVACEVDVLIDVRQLPLSRKKGFSKKALQVAAETAGVTYRHVPELGDPKPGRDAARAGDHRLFVQIFSEHMATEEAVDALHELACDMKGQRLCLLCFEKDHQACHRSIVAERLSEVMGAPVEHLSV